MTGPHERFEVLISASLSGDLSEIEAAELEAHLQTCDRCSATQAAFGEQRRMIGGLRHAPTPRDLGARVRGGIEAGAYGPAPWWRRGWAVFAAGGAMAVAAGALLAVVIFNALPLEPVGDASPTVAPSPTEPASPEPTAEPSPVPSPPVGPSPTQAPLAVEPELYLALTGPFDNLLPTVRDGLTGETRFELAALSGPPVAAALSPDGQWLAYIAEVGLKGTHELWATRVAQAPEPTDEQPFSVDSPIPVGESVLLGESASGSPFLEHLAWQSEGRYLAYTVADFEGNRGTDVWIFEPGSGEWYQYTAGGSTYAGSWIPGSAGTSCLWVGVAGSTPVSHLLCRHDDAGPFGGPSDPAEVAQASVNGAFQPLLNRDGSAVIFWRGVMAESGAGTGDWTFAEGGAPYIAAARVEDGTFGWGGDQPLFSDVTVGRDAFASAAIRWGADGDAYLVWDAAWTGVPQSPDGSAYPDPARVYLGHLSDPRLLTRFHALDPGDIPADGFVADVAVAPDGWHLAVTVRYPLPGDLAAPRADLLLVTRNTGDVADEVRVLAGGEGREGWFGPAVYRQL